MPVMKAFPLEIQVSYNSCSQPQTLPRGNNMNLRVCFGKRRVLFAEYISFFVYLFGLLYLDFDVSKCSIVFPDAQC